MVTSAIMITEVLPGECRLESMFAPSALAGAAPVTDTMLRVVTVTTSPLVLLFSRDLGDEGTTVVVAKATASDNTEFDTTTATDTPGPA